MGVARVVAGSDLDAIETRLHNPVKGDLERPIPEQHGEDPQPHRIVPSASSVSR